MLRSLEKDLEIPRFTFGTDSLQEWNSSSGPLVAEGDRTALGEVVRKTIERYRGAPMAGVLLITDGGQNSGAPLGEAARQLKDAGIPVYAVGVGDPAARDVAIEGVEMREVLLADDAAPVTVKLRTQGMKGESGRVIFSLGGVDVAEEEVEIGEDGLQEVSTLFVPRRVGEYVLEARFESDGASEALAGNNSGRTSLRVVDRRLKVLLLDPGRQKGKAQILVHLPIPIGCGIRKIAEPGLAVTEFPADYAQFGFMLADLQGRKAKRINDTDGRHARHAGRHENFPNVGFIQPEDLLCHEVGQDAGDENQQAKEHRRKLGAIERDEPSQPSQHRGSQYTTTWLPSDVMGPVRKISQARPFTATLPNVEAPSRVTILKPPGPRVHGKHRRRGPRRSG